MIRLKSIRHIAWVAATAFLIALQGVCPLFVVRIISLRSKVKKSWDSEYRFHMKISGFTDFKMESPGCHPGVSVFRADFKLNSDVSPLFPYIHRIIESSLYFEKPLYIQFDLEGYHCALYPDNLSAGMFENREQAIEFFEKLSSFLNDIAEKKDSIAPNHNFHKPRPVFDIFKMLPKTNCKECGFPTCMAFAAAVSKNETDLHKCPYKESKSA